MYLATAAELVEIMANNPAEAMTAGLLAWALRSLIEERR
jgi:hypothetical protein